MEEAGGIVAIIADNDFTDGFSAIGMLNDNKLRQLTIPAIFISGMDGFVIPPDFTVYLASLPFLHYTSIRKYSSLEMFHGLALR